ncbi:MAG: hypothetical protein NVV74_11620 [Magnetospirillum sp.]|nr:hypothetical protein [Magnetospirillum sp.]
MTGDEANAVILALLPGLRYLAAEALRSGCHDVSLVIYDAISTIERRMLVQGGNDEQRDLCQTAIRSDLAH